MVAEEICISSKHEEIKTIKEGAPRKSGRSTKYSLDNLTPARKTTKENEPYITNKSRGREDLQVIVLYE